MARRLVATAIVFAIIVGLLGLVQVDLAALTAQKVPTDWWWSGVLPLLAGSAMPPLFGIAMVIATRRLLLSLAAGVLLAAILAAGPGPIDVTGRFVGGYMWGAVADYFHLAVLLFTVTLIGMVNVASHSGGTQGVVAQVQRFAKGVRGARMATAVMGLAVFFDDYANTAIVGPTMRPLFDRMRLSREKLAYLIDSTAAPVAGLAIISTWVGAEVGYLQQAASGVGLERSGYAIFLSALGYRFYCIFALALVFILSWTGRDFGPMLAAETRALMTGQLVRPGSKPLSGAKEPPPLTAPPRWINAVVPIGAVLLLIVGGIHAVGAPQGSGAVGLVSAATWRDAFLVAGDILDGNFLGYLFAASAFVGSVIAIAMPAAQGILSVRGGLRAWVEGARSMVPALAVLVLAWALAAGCKDLSTAKYVGSALSGIAASWVPLVVFVVAGMVAFATGTSWGTMGILVPTAGAVAYEAGGEGIMIIAMAAVLDGAIFGDHCSPISDTTVLSSICSGSDHMDHVRTQVPYALLGAGVAGVFGYGMVAVGGAPQWLAYVLGFAVLVAVVRLVGKHAPYEPAARVTLDIPGIAAAGGEESPEVAASDPAP